ncbi:hypothetical protein NC653_030834 [Populus alba x Populus x berolinensis]|uniref:Uncharacterized protein n=1 Tax=Populus alba x Populus x berolinensis TaxID=444605 RepID=A0AAD6LX99_9ROSI|nr:hypothetical protein NC653_030834 [Populus alba x Populus x berolinensis]
MEDKHEEVEDIESGLSDSFIDDDDDDDSDNDDDNEPSTSGQDDGTRIQEPLTDQEVEELVAEFLEVESKAAEAQEALEKESLAKIESDVREELAQSLQGDDLEAAVEDEMATFREEWENVLDELETESYHLLILNFMHRDMAAIIVYVALADSIWLEQLDGTGIELPSLYKWIESQAPNSCCTEAWKRRAHWVGTQVTKETTDTVADAEKYLQIHRLLDGKKKLAMDGSEAIAENGEVDWASMKKLFSTSSSEDVASFGSRHWASVYLANTPQEAALMGLKFPGVNEVEEIEDIDGNSSDPFVAEAIANEKELVLSEEQRKKLQKGMLQSVYSQGNPSICEVMVITEMGTNMAESLPLDDNYHEATCQDLKKDVCENSGDLDMEQLMNESNSVFPESECL